MCGRHGDAVRVLVESKFWAALTDNQPVGYLAKLGLGCLLMGPAFWAPRLASTATVPGDPSSAHAATEGCRAPTG